MILIIDNYDSFTYNLVQLVGQHTKELRVLRNDAATIEEIRILKPDRIIISPGPGRPENAGVCVELVRRLGAVTPILGVCLGHQAIGYAFGGLIAHAPRLMHGKTSRISHDGSALYKTVPDPFEATRYHSLIVNRESLPPELAITSATEDGVIMGIRHKEYPIEGIQFHPESVLTTAGCTIIANWMNQRQ